MGVPSLKVFIFERLLIRIDAFATCTVAFSDVATLDHEAVDYAVYFAAQVVQLARLSA